MRDVGPSLTSFTTTAIGSANELRNNGALFPRARTSFSGSPCAPGPSERQVVQQWTISPGISKKMRPPNTDEANANKNESKGLGIAVLIWCGLASARTTLTPFGVGDELIREKRLGKD